jgi:hypothetical protein
VAEGEGLRPATRRDFSYGNDWMPPDIAADAKHVIGIVHALRILGAAISTERLAQALERGCYVSPGGARWSIQDLGWALHEQDNCLLMRLADRFGYVKPEWATELLKATRSLHPEGTSV